jgi:hypothetical protein
LNPRKHPNIVADLDVEWGGPKSVIGDYESIAMSEHLSLLLRIGLPIKPMEHIVVEEVIAQGGKGTWVGTRNEF